MSVGTINSCPVCGYPISEPSSEGQNAVCAYCSTPLQAEITQGVTIPTGLFAGTLGFIIGVLVGPALKAGVAKAERRIA